MSSNETYEYFGMRFRPMAESDLEVVRIERNKPEMRRLMTTDHEITAEETVEWFRSLPKDSRYWMVEMAGRVVGQINFKSRSGNEAESGFIFWDENFKKGGGPLWAILTLYHLAFNVCGMKKLHGVVLEGNTSAVKITKYFGFHQVGERVINSKRFLVFEMSAAEYAIVSAPYRKFFYNAETENSNGCV